MQRYSFFPYIGVSFGFGVGVFIVKNVERVKNVRRVEKVKSVIITVFDYVA